jgi:hypothetical protein
MVLRNSILELHYCVRVVLRALRVELNSSPRILRRNICQKLMWSPYSKGSFYIASKMLWYFTFHETDILPKCRTHDRIILFYFGTNRTKYDCKRKVKYNQQPITVARPDRQPRPRTTQPHS